MPRNVCRNYETFDDYTGSTISLASALLAELMEVNASKSEDVLFSARRSTSTA